MLEDVRETRVRDGPREEVTLSVVTSTPRQRKLFESYQRQCTPIGELPPAGRKRRSAESSARSRAMLRLQPENQAQHLAKRKVRRGAAPKNRRAAGRGQTRPAPMDSEWQRAEIDRQLMELEEEARHEEAKTKIREEPREVLLRVFDREVENDEGQLMRRDQLPEGALRCNWFGARHARWTYGQHGPEA